MFLKRLPRLTISSLLTLMVVNSLTLGSAFAEAAKKKEAAGNAGRKKIIMQEGRAKGASKTNIDFDAAAIDGERRVPAGVAIGGAKQDNEYDLINLRLRWHPEMIKSTSNLETGKSQ